MMRKGLAIWLLVLVSYGSAGPRIKRTGLTPLFAVSQPAPTDPYSFPMWKIPRYTGEQLQSVELSHNEHPTENEISSVDSFPDQPVNELEEPDEEESYENGGSGSIFSFIPGGLSGLISLSTGSASNGDEQGRIADDRSGLVGLKKDILTTVLQKKKDLLTALKRDAIQLVIRKVKAKKAWIKNLLFGSPYPGYYYKVPYYYPKKSSILSYAPFVGHWFGSGTELHEAKLPYLPNLMAVKAQYGKSPYPYQSETYVKVDYPGKDKLSLKSGIEYQVPSTSYGVAENSVSVPHLPYYEKNLPAFSQASFETVFSTTAPEIATPQVYPYPPESPALPQYNQPARVEPVFPYSVPYTYSQASYPYASSDYYDTAQSEIHPVQERPVYTNSEGRKEESGVENSLQDTLNEGSTVNDSVNGDNTKMRAKKLIRNS